MTTLTVASVIMFCLQERFFYVSALSAGFRSFRNLAASETRFQTRRFSFRAHPAHTPRAAFHSGI
jgi:hypothetical protein